MAAGLLAHPFGHVDDENRGVGFGGAAEHVGHELPVSGRVDDRVPSAAVAKPNAGRVDGDGLIALGLQGVEHEGPFHLDPAALAGSENLLELAVGQAVGVVQQTADEGRLAVVDVSDDDDPQGLLVGVHYMYPEERRRSKESSLS